MIKLFQPWWKKKQRPASVVLAPDNIPKHVAIIMDGNGALGAQAWFAANRRTSYRYESRQACDDCG
ncbi:hypothetical protein HMSSN036_36480 [Paenibacillus macerans]|nr:hypothetical protein HMSSN036_36480 [Paenibacillus macerans]